MKKIIYLFLLATVVVACSKTPEQKAEAIIKEELKKSLYKPDTYKPIDTKVDSAFAPYDDAELFNLLTEYGELNRNFEILEAEARSEKSSMALWNDPYMSEYSRNEYQEAKEKYDEANAKIEIIREKGIKIAEKIKAKLEEGRKFIGYKVEHNYRADNNAGNTMIGDDIFFFDKNMEKIVFAVTTEGYNSYLKDIKTIEEEIKSGAE